MSGPVHHDGETAAAPALHPDSAEALAAEIARARREGRRVLPAGSRSRLAAAGLAPEADVVLSTEALGRVLQYEPADLTVTVEAGCTLAALDRVLAERGQILPLQPGRARGTVGGLVASAPEGATALAHGGVRDHLTGLRAALADGTIVKGGGRVVKNVAGYGIHRLMAGSRGTLGVIVEASFKVQPRPEARGSVLFEMKSGEGALEAAGCVLDSGLEPLFVDVLVEAGTHRLAVGFEGMEERVTAHVKRVAEIVARSRPRGSRAMTQAEDARMRRALDDWTDPAAAYRPAMGAGPGIEEARASAPPGEARAHVVVRLATLPGRIADVASAATSGSESLSANTDTSAIAVVDIRPGIGSAFVVIESEGAPEAAAVARGVLRRARTIASAVLLAAPREIARALDVWGPPPPDFFLMKKIKQALDPDGVFAPGGFVGGL